MKTRDAPDNRSQAKLRRNNMQHSLKMKTSGMTDLIKYTKQDWNIKLLDTPQRCDSQN